jgi:RHS repeat-associated protein
VGDSLAGFVPDLDEATMLAHLGNPLADPAGILASATTRILVDPGAFYRTRGDPRPAPPVTYTLARETHVSDLAASQVTRYQHAFAYSDGFARVIQRKARAAPGPLAGGGPTISPRWVGSGWTIFDNKGRPVRKYEPFFSATNGFEFAAVAGVSSVFFYDPPGRQVAVLHPDRTWQKVVLDPWRQVSWDGGDTVLVSDPRADPDVGDHFRRLLGSAPVAFTSWYHRRITGTYGATGYDRAAEQDAARKAAPYAATPSAAHFDSLGRVCLTVNDNGGGQLVPSRIALDTEGKPLAIFDALARRAEERCLRVQQAGARQYVAGTDMAGNPLFRNSMDGGARRSLANVAGKPIRAWDARGHAFRTRYDPSLRPTHRYVSTGGAPEVLLDRFVYGEGQPGANLCGRLLRHYDTAGAVFTDRYDYTGNLVSSARLLATEYRHSPDWLVLADLTDPAALDAAAAPLLAPGDRFDATTSYDALNRPIQSVTPHSASMKPNVTRPSFDEGGLVNRVDVWRQQAAGPSGLLDPATADLHAVTAISYNARGQRTQTATGNGTVTTFTYDPATFRLTRLTTTRLNPRADQRVVQDLAYYYDPVGNITRIHDTADTQDVIFFNNQRVEPSSDYTYDPLYRLARATGREHLGQTSSGVLRPPAQVANDDSFRTGLPEPGDGKAMATYTEKYAYDPADNITAMTHQVSSGSWTRRYAYDQQSQIDPAEGSNRLAATSIPGDPAGGPYHASYAYDAHGNMTQMPYLSPIAWDEQDRIASTARHLVSGTAAPATYYCYDSDAQRVRKTTDSLPAADQPASRRKERVYLGAVEIYREYGTSTTAPTLARETLQVHAADEVVCLDEARTTGTDRGAVKLTRYQHTNHLGSAVLELDAAAQIISYEEYFPYGSTSYQSVSSATETPKRYRYTGKERDEENDLYYHGARYYAPWLGRWTSCDSMGRDGLNRYWYVQASPTIRVDPTGKYAEAGHFYTAFAMALAGGMTPEIARRVAIFTQAADEIEELDAIGVVPPLWNAENRARSKQESGENETVSDRQAREKVKEHTESVQVGGHALSGRPSEEERSKRADILLGLTPGSPEYGAAVHAFGDSFAHSEPLDRNAPDTSDADMPLVMLPQHQYGGSGDFPFGHARAGTDPDNIKLRPQLYARYAMNLYEIFRAQAPQTQVPEVAKGSSADEVMALLEKVGASKTEADRISVLKDFIRAHAGTLDYAPETASNLPFDKAVKANGNPAEFKEINVSKISDLMGTWKGRAAPTGTVEQVIAGPLWPLAGMRSAQRSPAQR